MHTLRKGLFTLINASSRHLSVPRRIRCFINVYLSEDILEIAVVIRPVVCCLLCSSQNV